MSRESIGASSSRVEFTPADREPAHDKCRGEARRPHRREQGLSSGKGGQGTTSRSLFHREESRGFTHALRHPWLRVRVLASGSRRMVGQKPMNRFRLTGECALHDWPTGNEKTRSSLRRSAKRRAAKICQIVGSSQALGAEVYSGAARGHHSGGLRRICNVAACNRTGAATAHEPAGNGCPLPDQSGVTWVPGIGPKNYGDCTRVLTIDGGGVRGLIPALVLAELERRTGGPIAEQFDLIVGTSTGSILALGLTRPSNADARRPALAAKDLVALYRDQAARIFPSSLGPLRYLRRIFRPKFDPSDVEALYRSYFEDVRLQEALTNVAVPAYESSPTNALVPKLVVGSGRLLYA